MLEQLTIKNVAVIDSLEVSFKNGVTVLTGETGAGKSIIIDSINMILGSRANKELVRRGCEKAEVQAVFSMTPKAAEILEEQGIDAEDESIIISRRVTAEGKSTARINGTVVTLNILREIADMLVNIHGQHDNQALLTPSKHIEFLDAYACTDDILAQYKLHYGKCRKIAKAIHSLQSDEQAKMQRADLLSYQVNEIYNAHLVPGEEEELLSQLKLLENAERINISVEEAYVNLYEYPDGQSAYDMVSNAVKAMEGIADLSDDLKAAYDELMSAMYAIEDAAHEIREFGENVEFNPQALYEAQERLELINKLKRKYGASIEEVIQYGKKAQTELDEITNSDERLESLKEELEHAKAELKKTADELTKKRVDAAAELEKEIENALHELNMEKAVFSVFTERQKYTSDGADYVEFMITTNPGESLKPLVKIASGGELSRVMLAIKSVLAKTDSVGTLIFDEIDTGVSGSAAQKIADKLKTIGDTKQVICITHLPQLTSSADNHFLIVKDVAGELASTTLTELDFEGRMREIARIVGGGEAGEIYARDLLKNRVEKQKCSLKGADDSIHE